MARVSGSFGRRAGVAGAALFCILALVTPAAAATYNVSTVAELTGAVDALNAGEGGDIIILAPGFYALTRELDTKVPVWIVGDEAAPTILDAATPGIAVENYGSEVRLYNLTLQHALTAIANESNGAIYGTGLTIAGNQTGIYAGDSGGTTTLVNSTVTGNTQEGILVQCSDLTLLNSTVTNNRDGIYFDFSCAERMELTNSIIAGNTRFDCHGGDIDPEGVASIDGDGTCVAMGFTAAVTTCLPATIGLGPLAANGGPTMTVAIPAGSAAAGAADATRCPATDQRGFGRTDGACDAGAYEAGAVAGPAGNTPAGVNVALSPAPGVSITFPLVIIAGDTTAVTMGGAPPVPAGFQVDGAVYEIATTALFAGSATVCLPYDPLLDPHPILNHWQTPPGAWVDVTVSTDDVAHIVCGEVSSFSPFAVMSFASGAGDVGNTLMVAMQSIVDRMFTLSWGPSCAAGDADYDIYMGTIGSWYSHFPIVCGTGGQRSVDLSVDGNVYFLIVPRNEGYEGYEGSYGSSSAGVPIPRPAGACAVQNVALTCP